MQGPEPLPKAAQQKNRPEGDAEDTEQSSKQGCRVKQIDQGADRHGKPAGQTIQPGNQSGVFRIGVDEKGVDAKGEYVRGTQTDTDGSQKAENQKPRPLFPEILHKRGRFAGHGNGCQHSQKDAQNMRELEKGNLQAEKSSDGQGEKPVSAQISHGKG